MLAAVTIDVSALWHTVVIAFAAGLVAILAASTVIFSVDRADRGGETATARAPWLAIAFAGVLVVAAIIVLGIWAMTQK